MEKEEFESAIKEIGTCEDDVQRRTLLTELNEKMGTVFGENETLKESEKKLKEDNEVLRDANMKYFLRLESQNKNAQQQKEDSTGIKQPENKEPRKFEDLFDDKGGIK